MHKLLNRIIRRHLNDNIDISSLESFLDILSLAFEQNDSDQKFLERSLRLMSDELNEINQTLRNQLLDSKHSQQRLEETLANQRAIIDTTPVAILNFDVDGTLSHANTAGLAILNLSEQELRANTLKENARALLEKLIDPDSFLTILKNVKKNKLTIIQTEIETKEGSKFECYSAPAIHENKYISRVWCFRDVTESIRNREKLHYKAFHDDLTNLPNRSLLLKSIDHAMALGKRNNTKVAILFIDLDDFKKINDTAGHEKGDQFLISISSEIKGVILALPTLHACAITLTHV
ncbi:MAG: sensor domain-containing diguanylate cyclase [Lentimonas sp.]